MSATVQRAAHLLNEPPSVLVLRRPLQQLWLCLEVEEVNEPVGRLYFEVVAQELSVLLSSEEPVLGLLGAVLLPVSLEV